MPELVRVRAERIVSPGSTLRRIARHHLILATIRSFLAHNGIASSAALAYYFLLSVLPFLIFLAGALVLLPIPHLATRMIYLASHFVPSQTMPMVDSMLKSTMHTDTKVLSAGFILAALTASNAIAVMVAALDTIYESDEKQSFWGSRFRALYITGAVGLLNVVALVTMLLGPHFGRELARVFAVSGAFVDFWPVLRYVLAVSCALASIELLYFLGPRREHSLRQQLPGSIFAVLVWIASTALMGIYLRRFSYMNAMYGTLTSFIVFMIWMQITAAAILLGAELNVQLEKVHGSESV